MIPKEAIEKAIEGGWAPPTSFAYRDLVNDVPTIKDANAIALDPTFWQCLGKALGWDDDNYDGRAWKEQAHYCYELILTGADIKPFWDELLR